MIVNLVPGLEGARSFINQGAFLLVAVFVAGKSLEDAATAWKGVEKDPPPVSPDITDKLPEMAKIFWDLFNEKLLSQENNDQPVNEPAPVNVGTTIPSASVYDSEYRAPLT